MAPTCAFREKWGRQIGRDWLEPTAAVLAALRSRGKRPDRSNCFSHRSKVAPVGDFLGKQRVEEEEEEEAQPAVPAQPAEWRPIHQPKNSNGRTDSVRS